MLCTYVTQGCSLKAASTPEIFCAILKVKNLFNQIHTSHFAKTLSIHRPTHLELSGGGGCFDS